ncbi:MAG: HD domain-containing protein [Planctomycetes bacterium]|nr:HD domain-containing protein [Planctomycetota bacterium]
MALTLEDARAILAGMMEKPALLAHVESVSIVMAALARKHGADEATWAIAGLLHDADYERWPEEHPRRIVALLRERGEEEIAHAISAHYTRWGVLCESLLDRALLATDELTGFIIAVARVRPQRLQDLTAASVRKKLKDPTFAQGVDRNEVARGLEVLGVDLAEHAQFIIDALRPHERRVIP